MADLADLISGCRDNDGKAQRALYDLLHPKMLGICLRYARDVDQAHDMLQEGFIKVFQRIDQFGGKGAFEGWVRKIIVNACLEILRKERSAGESIVEEHESMLVVEKGANPLEVLQAQDVLALVQQLPVGYRTVFNLFAIEGYSHEEIAKTLNVSVNTSYSQYHRAKAMMQRMLNSEKKRKIKQAI